MAARCFGLVLLGLVSVVPRPAAASLSLDQPLLEDELGLRLSGNRSFTGLLFRVNGERGDYATVPQGLDGNLGLTWDYSATGQLKFFAFARRSRIGVETAEGAYAGVYRSRSTNQLYNLQWTMAPGRWTVEASASWSAYSSDRTFGVTYRYTTGQPFTPVIETERSASGRLLPVDGSVGSERLPSHQRLDLQWSYYWPFNRQQHLILYAAVNNAVDRTNAVDVTYTPDYSERQYRTTDFRRSIYVGLTLTL